MPRFSESDAGVDEHLGGVMRTIGHDLRNKLGVMRNSAYYLNMKVGQQSEKLSKHVGILLKQIDMSSWIIGNLMDLTAARPPTFAETDLNALVSNVLRRSIIPEGVQVTRMLAPNLPMVRADAEQLGRAIENVVVCQCASLGEDHGLRVASRLYGGKVYVELADSGPGLPQEEEAHLFDLKLAGGFSPLKIGLVVARRLIELNHASLEVESKQGIGTRFTIIIPALDALQEPLSNL